MTRWRRSSGLDAAELSRLYREYAHDLHRYLARRTFDVEVAFDLVAETFAAAYRDRAQYRGATDQEALAWIYGIGRHQLSHYFRRGEAESRALERYGLERPAFDDDDLRRAEELAGIAFVRRRIRSELARLSHGQRDALVMRIVDELPYEEIAEELGISEQTVRARVSRGLRTLANALEQDRGSIA
jgi:RNA polymerase sigma-70 factor (ECF subfamily)